MVLFTKQVKSDHETEQLFYFGGAFETKINENWYQLKPVVCFAKQNEKSEKRFKFNHVEIIKVHKHNILFQIDLNHFYQRIE